MMFHLILPPSALPERLYVWNELLQNRLGHAYTWNIREEATETRLTLEHDGKAAIIIPDIFFRMWEESRSKITSVSNRRMKEVGVPLMDPGTPFIWKYEDMNLPLIFYLHDIPVPGKEHGCVVLPFDLPGGVFFFLSRYEELNGPVDSHGRFPGQQSWSARHGLLQKPIVDEYERVLRRSILSLWPRLSLKEHTFCIMPTHDVDWPFVSWGQPVKTVLKNALGDVFKRKDFHLAFRRLFSRFMNRPEKDPAYTFDFLMDLSEELGWTSTFFFITGGEDDRWENCYRHDQSEVSTILKRILERGHRVGLHGSYHSLEYSGRLKQEADRLRSAIRALGYDYAGMGGRQHYLKGAIPLLWRESEQAGLAFDSSMGYADVAGFRAGTSREYQPYDIFERRTFALLVKPLVVMDRTLMNSEYMALDEDHTICVARSLYRTCEHVCGDFLFLWHNSSIQGKHGRRLYGQLIKLYEGR